MQMVRCSGLPPPQGIGKESDQRPASHPVGFKPIRCGADRVAGVVSGTVGDDAGILGIVLGQLENDLHQIAADVGDLGEDSSADAQDCRSQALADGKPDETRPHKRRRDKHQDGDHAEQFHAHQQHADRHARLQWDRERGERIARQTGKCRTAVGLCIDANAKPGHAVAAEDPEDRAEQNDPHRHRRGKRGGSGRFPRSGMAADGIEKSKVGDDGSGDQQPEQGQKPSLLKEIALAGFPNDVGNRGH